VVLVMDRLKSKYSRLVLPRTGAPVALAVSPKHLAILLDDQSKRAALVLYEMNSTGSVKYVKTLSLQAPQPQDLKMESKGTGLLVLFRGHLARVSISTLTPSGANVTLLKKIVMGKPPQLASNLIAGKCVGLDYAEPPSTSAGMGTAYLACNISSSLCRSGQSCPAWGQLVKVGPVLKCLGSTITPLPSKNPCWVTTTSKTPLPFLGAPVVDSKNKKIYLRTPGFVTYLPLDSQPASSQIKTLPLFIALKWQGASAAPDQMVLDADGHLFAASGPLVHRLLPQQSSEKLRRGLPFTVGQSKEESLFLTLSSDGSLLDVIRRDYGSLHSLISVCLKRCPGCLCQ